MISDLELDTEVNGALGQIRLSGQVDMSNCHQLGEAIDSLLDVGANRLVINGKNLNFIDSSCLGMLVSALRRIRESDGRMALVVNPYIERVITVAGLSPFFEVYYSPEEAIELLLQK